MDRFSKNVKALKKSDVAVSLVVSEMKKQLMRILKG
jgi:hypothetical protein